MSDIKFGTDGWRAIIDKDFTVENVARVSEATALWLRQQDVPQAVVIGYDCRAKGRLFAEAAASVFTSHGIEVYLPDAFVSTPMVSYGVTKLNAGFGVVITASHNPPEYNGYKLKSHYGGPTLPDGIAAIESLLPGDAPTLAPPAFERTDLDQLYLDAVHGAFDVGSIHNSGIRIAFDAMFGAGQNIVRKLFPEAALLRCKLDPTFQGQAPEPIAKNLMDLSDLVAANTDITFGLATDGDADRLGVFDENGKFVDAHHIILLLVYYLHVYKKMTGKVVVAFSATDKIKKLCAHYGLEYIITKIGFKHICKHMVEDDVLVGGEESGGIAVKGHIPERDGVWDALLLLEFMAETGKKLSELVAEVYDIVGAFTYDRLDMHLDLEKKEQAVARCSNGLSALGRFEVESMESIDGYKFHLGEERWVLIRPSGTEPLLRVYAEGRNRQEVQHILADTRDTILS